jgi:mRNA interferase RelE/StbE
LDWTIEYSPLAGKQLEKLDRHTRRRILAYLESVINDTEHPTHRGKPLTDTLSGTWRYRAGDYRILCEIQNHRLVVLVIRIGHRSNIYD